MRSRDGIVSLVVDMASHLSYDVLSRIVERRAAPIEEARAQRHLMSCGRCRSELAWLERIRSLPQGAGDLGHLEYGSEAAGDGWGNLGRVARSSSSALLS
jgi:hypothetical protein